MGFVLLGMLRVVKNKGRQMTRNQAKAVLYGRKKSVYLGTQVVKCECGCSYIIRPHDKTMNFTKCPTCRKQDKSGAERGLK